MYPYYVPKDKRLCNYLERKLIQVLALIVVAFGIVLHDFVTNTLWMLI